jgi:hypothetical protein
MAFPAAVISLTDPTPADKLGTSVGGNTHSALHAAVNAALNTISTKAGISESAAVDTPAANAALISLTNAKSKWLAGAARNILGVDASGVIGWLSGQIPFPAAQNASADANTLDDYEEGTWTPQLDQGASTNIGKTVIYASYVKIGKLVFFNLRLDITAAGTSGSAVTATLPITAAAATATIIGAGSYFDAAGGAQLMWAGFCRMSSTTQVDVVVDTSNANSWGVSPAAAAASGDALFLSGHYIAAN